MYNAGLVLEGGGMKGIYTSGVLDYLLEKDLEFSHGYGVSAGSGNLCNFISRQKRRSYRITMDYLDNKKYCSSYSLLTTGDLFNVKMCYDLIPNILNPFDYETFKKYQGCAYAVVTNIETGEPEYLRLKDMHKDIAKVRASCSLPLVSRNVTIGGKKYLDGGISDSIPIRHSIMEGNEKNLVILTKEEGYRRSPTSNLGLIKAKYIAYPQVYHLMERRHVMYNETLDFLEKEKQNGTAFVIRPKHPSDVARIEHNRSKMEALYQTGYQDAKDSYEDLIAFLEK